MLLDDVDLMIIEELAADGRSSLRDLSRRTGLSPPAIARRLSRLRGAGLIGDVRASVDLSKISGWTSAAVLVRAEPNGIDDVAGRMSAIDGVTELYRATGPYSLLARVEVRDVNALSAVVRRIESMEGVRDVEVLVLGERLKDEPPKLVAPPVGSHRVNLRCEYCGNEILGKPHVLEHDGVTRYFCCPTCLREFKAEHGIVRDAGSHLLTGVNEIPYNDGERHMIHGVGRRAH